MEGVLYGEAIENPENRSEIQTPYDIDKCFGSYYTTQKSKLKSYMHYPGLDVFLMTASKINIGFLDLKDGSFPCEWRNHTKMTLQILCYYGLEIYI